MHTKLRDKAWPEDGQNRMERQRERGSLSPELRLLPVGSCCAENVGDPSGDARWARSLLPKVVAQVRPPGRRPAPAAVTASVEVSSR